jgi:homocitrate synthase NifV
MNERAAADTPRIAAPIVEDTTLRDGEQAPGIVFSIEEKVAIASLLDRVGVPMIEVGIPAMGGQECEAIRRIQALKLNARLVGWNRGKREDLEASFDLGLTHVHIGLPSSKQLLEDGLRRDRTWLLKTMAELVGYAKSRAEFVSLSAEDVCRAEPDFLLQYARVAKESGADRLRMSDTVGLATPESYAGLVARVSQEAGIPVMVHAHNDFGLGVANTLAGLAAGARYCHVTVNGVGERAGMPPLDEVVLALKHLYGVDLGWNLKLLPELAERVSKACGVPLHPWKPIVGSNVFAHESGIHVAGMLRNEKTFEPISPDEVGAQRRLVLGKHSGSHAIEAVLRERGVVVEPERAQHLLGQVRSEAVRKKRAITVEELEELNASLA